MAGHRVARRIAPRHRGDLTMRDLRSNIVTTHCLAPAARTNGTATGAGVDLQGYKSLTAVVHYGDWTDGTHTPAFHESDDGTTYTAVGTADLLGGFTALSGTAGENTVQEVSYNGSKRYARVHVVTASATTGAVSSAVLIRAKGEYAPA
jgi:hypothetical protein